MKKLLFFDPAAVAWTKGGASLHVCPPEVCRTAFEREYPYEHFYHLYSSLIYDPDAAEYRIYYGARDRQNRTTLALAVSKDAVRWEKPKLGVFAYEGSTENNLLGLPFADGSVLRDEHAPPEERYHFLMHRAGKGYFCYRSADGIHWDKNPVLLAPCFLDGHNNALWDETDGCYRFYLRAWNRDPLRRTAVGGTCDSLMKPLDLPPDLPRRKPEEQPILTEQAFPLVMRADELDQINGVPTTPSTGSPVVPSVGSSVASSVGSPVAPSTGSPTDVYTFPVSLLPGETRAFAAFPSFYRHKTDGTLTNDGWLDVRFCGSVDGMHFHRFDRAVYFGNLSSGEFENQMAFHGTGVLPYGGRLLSSGLLYRTRHGEVDRRSREGDGKMVLFEQRKDGFVSLRFDENGGEASLGRQTVGRALTLNVKTAPGGSLTLCFDGAETLTVKADDTALTLPVPENVPASCELTVRGRYAELYSITFQ